ncbi:flagellar biosynthesis protein FlgA [Pengzhenrongella phosphoraccumulans]|uniref:flagellar biosynthesis protein FlgA n=1 Tax=Pengzhenrongella phosphoraccumulans TaxID=3114394 RepID=UPI00388ED733
MPRLPLRHPPDGSPRAAVARRTPTHRARLLAWRLRFPVAATLLGVAVALVVGRLSPAPTPTVPVVVAARLLAPGALVAADLRVVRLPPALVPRGSHRGADDVVGHELVIGAPPGLPIVDTLLAGDRLAAAGPAGSVVAPIRLADPAVAALLRPGDRIDVLAATGSADGEPVVRRLAERAIVLVRPGADAASTAANAIGGGILSGGGADPGTGELTLVAVTPAEAADLAGASSWASLSAVVVG